MVSDDMRMDGRPDPGDEIVDNVEEFAHKLNHRQFNLLRHYVSSEEERRMELSEGDLLERRRRVDKLLNDKNINEIAYGSLQVRWNGDQLQVLDVDWDWYATIGTETLKLDDPVRIERVQDRLDQIHFESLGEL